MMIKSKNLEFNFLKEKNISILFGILAVTFVTLAIIGGVRNYSPVPYWDMWDGYLGFYSEISTGNTSQWWAQHNEHRIFLARILFWIDISFFKGYGWFLIIINYVLIITSYLFFSMLLKEQYVSNVDHLFRKILNFLILILLFSWIQKNNLVWGFQNQFFLAQLLPLISFFLLHKSHLSHDRSRYYFLLACLIAVMSTGSMANGILALPLLIIFALILHMNRIRIVTLILLSTITLGLYFYNYQSPGGHGSLKYALLNNPIELLQFLLLYIGGPFSYLSIIGSETLALAAGTFLILSAIVFAWKALKNPSTSSSQLVLLIFILYVGGTALGTGGGRLILGIEQALVSRYQTPVLMAWVALLILYAPIMANKVKNQVIRSLPFLLIPLLLLPKQLQSIEIQQNSLFERWVAALALELGIKDQQQITSIFPSAEWALSISKFPAQKNLSIFGHPLIKDINKLIGQLLVNNSLMLCSGNLGKISTIEGVNDYVRLEGWLFTENAEAAPELIYIMNEAEKIIGYALTGKTRSNVEELTNQQINSSGFKGYILANELGQGITLRNYQTGCKLKEIAPFTPYTINPPVSENSKISIQSNQILNNNEWLGSDYYKTKKRGYKVFGSYINSDADMGKISMRIKRGDSLYYRSGPIGGNQRLVIESEKSYVQVLPIAIEWVVLKFNNSNLQETFTVTFKDTGGNPGEWSAVGVKSEN
jgi:hypothetical protein